MKRKILKKTALFFCIFGILNFSSLYSANFQDVLNKPFPDWMKNQIQECLDPFTNELSEEYLDQLFNNYHQRFQLMRIKYFNKKLFFQTPTKHIVNVEWKKIFNRLHRLGRLPPYDFDILISSADCIGCPSCNYIKRSDNICVYSKNDEIDLDFDHLPFLIQAECSHNRNIVFPDFLHLNTVKQAKEMKSAQTPWNNKKMLHFLEEGIQAFLIIICGLFVKDQV